MSFSKPILSPLWYYLRTFFKTYLVVELTKLGKHNFDLGLHSKNFYYEK